MIIEEKVFDYFVDIIIDCKQLITGYDSRNTRDRVN